MNITIKNIENYYMWKYTNQDLIQYSHYLETIKDVSIVDNIIIISFKHHHLNNTIKLKNYKYYLKSIRKDKLKKIL